VLALALLERLCQVSHPHLGGDLGTGGRDERGSAVGDGVSVVLEHGHVRCEILLAPGSLEAVPCTQEGTDADSDRTDGIVEIVVLLVMIDDLILDSTVRHRDPLKYHVSHLMITIVIILYIVYHGVVVTLTCPAIPKPRPPRPQ